MTTATVRSRGRPAVGERVAVRLPSELLTLIDRHAGARRQSRAAAIRALLTEALRAGPGDGVDRAQIRRMLELTPADRIRHMADVANAQTRLRGAARRRAR